jgi:uncharacterized damage-inducible protein DinB
MALLDVVQTSLADYFKAMIQERIHELVEPLSAEQLWQRPFPYGNSVGNLILHLTGNLNYYIGAQIARTGYVRHRDLEFRDAGKTKEEILRAFDDAIRTAVVAIGQQSDEDWCAPYSAERSDSSTLFGQVLACAGHGYHHVGQIIYLQKELVRKPMPVTDESCIGFLEHGES